MRRGRMRSYALRPPARKRPMLHHLPRATAALAMCAIIAVAGVAAASVRQVAVPDSAPEKKAAPPAAIDPVFECYTANSAWGLTYAGKVVDRQGKVWSYRQR